MITCDTCAAFFQKLPGQQNSTFARLWLANQVLPFIWRRAFCAQLATTRVLGDIRSTTIYSHVQSAFAAFTWIGQLKLQWTTWIGGSIGSSGTPRNSFQISNLWDHWFEKCCLSWMDLFYISLGSESFPSAPRRFMASWNEGFPPPRGYRFEATATFHSSLVADVATSWNTFWARTSHPQKFESCGKGKKIAGFRKRRSIDFESRPNREGPFQQK